MVADRFLKRLALAIPFFLPASTSGDELRVLVWNAWRGGNEVERGPEKVLAVIRAADPDLILMQESYDIDGERPTLGRWIASELGWNAYQSESPHLCVISPMGFNATHFHDPWHGVGVRIEDERGRAFVAWSIWLDYRAYITYALRDDPSMTDEQLIALETDASARLKEVKALLADVDAVSTEEPSIPTLVGGDFNCPSHLDWTVDTTRMYRHRRNLDLPVSLAMYENGFVDVFRQVHPDPIQHPGVTWSPMFREKDDGTVQAFDRIDRLYLRNPSVGDWMLVPVAAKTLPEGWEDDRIPVPQRVFPSDHGAVVLDLEWQPMEKRSLDLQVESVDRIADEAPHSAFTDLLRVDNRLYCTFREGDGHVYGADGRIRVLVRDHDGAWRSVALLAEDGIDLRDPKLSLMPDGRIMVLCGGSDYDDRTLVGACSRVAFSDPEGEEFGPVVPVDIDPAIRTDVDWLWRVAWDGSGTAWGVVYQPRNAGPSVRLMRSEDGIAWGHVADLPVEGEGNETALHIDGDGRMTALVRREGSDARAMLGHASPPYLDWTFDVLPEAIGGPELVRSPTGDGWIVSGRRYLADGARTSIWWRGDDGSWETLVTLPSGGDTSYPGMVIDEGRLLVSYYSGHEGRTAIHFAEATIVPRDDGASLVPSGAQIRFEDDVEAIIEDSRVEPGSYEGTMLVGSSIFRLWSDAEEDLSRFDVVNHGFGGSRTWELLEHAPRLVSSFRPRTIVVYCGSNDVNAGESASRISERLRRFTRRMEAEHPGVRIVHVSIARAPEKADLWPVVDEVNQSIRSLCEKSPTRYFVDVNRGLFDAGGEPRLDLYLDDRLHYTDQAYDDVFRPGVEAVLERIHGEGSGTGE